MKLPFQAEICYLDQLKYAEFNSIVHFCFKQEAPFLVSEGKQSNYCPGDLTRDFEIGSCRQLGFFILLW